MFSRIQSSDHPTNRALPQFDVVLTDPPDTLEAFAVWVSRASLALRGANSALYMGLTSVEAAVTKWFRMQQLAIAARFVITDLRFVVEWRAVRAPLMAKYVDFHSFRQDNHHEIRVSIRDFCIPNTKKVLRSEHSIFL